MKQKKFSKGWDEERVNRLIAHYESQSEEEAVAEDEEALQFIKLFSENFDGGQEKLG
jgi:hypothetical protein